MPTDAQPGTYFSASLCVLRVSALIFFLFPLIRPPAVNKLILVTPPETKVVQSGAEWCNLSICQPQSAIIVRAFRFRHEPRAA